MTVRPIGINHIAFEVRDLDEALEWYGRWFDLRLRGRRPTMAWIDLGDQFLALEKDRYAVREFSPPTAVVSRTTLPAKPEIWVLPGGY